MFVPNSRLASSTETKSDFCGKVANTLVKNCRQFLLVDCANNADYQTTFNHNTLVNFLQIVAGHLLDGVDGAVSWPCIGMVFEQRFAQSYRGDGPGIVFSPASIP